MPWPSKPIEQRMAEKAIARHNGCIEWIGGTNRKGYGIVLHDGSSRLAHRVAYELARGEIGRGMVIDHTCWNRSCVNPDHMRVVTQAENTQNLSGAHHDNQSGIRGVYRHRSGKWQAYARGKYLGLFDSKEEAGAAAAAWRLANMPYSEMDKRNVI